eukprot:gene14484-20508_t
MSERARTNRDLRSKQIAGLRGAQSQREIRLQGSSGKAEETARELVDATLSEWGSRVGHCLRLAPGNGSSAGQEWHGSEFSPGGDVGETETIPGVKTHLNSSEDIAHALANSLAMLPRVVNVLSAYIALATAVSGLSWVLGWYASGFSGDHVPTCQMAAALVSNAVWSGAQMAAALVSN